MPPAPTAPSKTEARRLTSKRKMEWESSAGITSGKTAKRMIWLWVAPTEPTDSSTFASSSSIASANSFPSIPTLPIARASTPGNGPTPNAATNNRSTIISGRARSTPINVRAVERNHPGDKLRAPAKPKKNESTTPSGVATAASSTVTSAGPTISCNELQSGGKKSAAPPRPSLAPARIRLDRLCKDAPRRRPTHLARARAAAACAGGAEGAGRQTEENLQSGNSRGLFGEQTWGRFVDLPSKRAGGRHRLRRQRRRRP